MRGNPLAIDKEFIFDMHRLFFRTNKNQDFALINRVGL
nr:H113 [uncultured bacterium]